MTITITHTEKSHRILGGSNAPRWTHCQGSVFLSRGLAKSVPGPRAIKGTHAHFLAEQALASFLQKKLTGTGIPGVAELISNEEDDEAADAVMRYCELVWTNVLGEFITNKAYGIEDEFTLHDGLDMGGTADFWCVYRDDRAKRIMCIVDFKFGYHEVDIGSEQFPFYACAAREELLAHGKDIDYVRCIVIQPPLGEENDYKEIKYTAKALDAWKKKFIKAGERIFVKEKPKFKTGKWCTYCPAQSKCIVYAKELAAGSSLDIVSARESELPKVETLPDEIIVKLVTHRKKFEKYLKSASAYAIGRHKEGKPISGLKVVEGLSKREWLADQTEVESNLIDLGLSKGEIYTVKLKGLGKIKDLLKEQGMKAKEADEAITPFTHRRSAALLLVPETDTRPPIAIGGDMLTDESDEAETDEN